MKTGYTLLKAEGGYSKQKKDMIMCVINNKDYYMFKNVVEEIDPHAFFIINAAGKTDESINAAV